MIDLSLADSIAGFAVGVLCGCWLMAVLIPRRDKNQRNSDEQQRFIDDLYRQHKEQNEK